MKSAVKNIFLIMMVSGIIFSGCIKAPNYSDIPAITFNNFIKYGTDSAALIFNFKDGDGDIGLNPGDTLAPYDFRKDKNKYYYDCFLEYLYKTSDGSFKPFYQAGGDSLFNDTIYFPYRLPNITPAGKVKVLSGKIQVMLHAPYYYPGHNEIEFRVYIYDRALHQSNVIYTPIIPVP